LGSTVQIFYKRSFFLPALNLKDLENISISTVNENQKEFAVRIKKKKKTTKLEKDPGLSLSNIPQNYQSELLFPPF
jgi:hypothetical protein